MKLPPSITAVLAKLGSASALRHDPARDWLVLLGIFLVALIASVGWNGWFLVATLSQEPPTVAASAPATSSDTYTTARERYDARAAEVLKYESEYRFNDPSK